MTTASVLNSIIPVSRFNKGEAGRIFDELRNDKTRIVVKNNKPVAVIHSSDEYSRLVEEKADSALLSQASLRMTHSRPTDCLTEQEFISAAGLTEAEIQAAGDIEID